MVNFIQNLCNIQLLTCFFISARCSYSKNLVPEYIKAAKALKGIVNVGAVDCDENEYLQNKFNIKGYPTIKIYIRTRGLTDYEGDRTAEEIIDAGLDAKQQAENDRIELNKRFQQLRGTLMSTTEQTIVSTPTNKKSLRIDYKISRRYNDSNNYTIGRYCYQ